MIKEFRVVFHRSRVFPWLTNTYDGDLTRETGHMGVVVFFTGVSNRNVVSCRVEVQGSLVEEEGFGVNKGADF